MTAPDPAPGVLIRPAAVADVPALQRIAAAAYAVYVPRMAAPPPPMSADYAGAVTRGEAWVAARDADVIGFAILVPRPGHLLLENVAVAPGEQGGGVGTRLLALAEEQAARLGLPEVRLYTNVVMTENLRYYARHGYAETHRAGPDSFRRVFFTKRLPGGLGPALGPRAHG